MSPAFKYRRLSRDDAAVLLVDHQSGLISLVQDYSPGEFQNNVLALADIAKYYKLPTILTTSFEDGPNGPMVPELKAMFPDAPYIPRPGQINAWDNEEFVKAVKAEGLAMHVWTVDEPAEAKRLAAAGVDSITTNRPAFLREKIETGAAGDSR